MKQKLIDFINVIFGLRKFLAWVALFLVAIVFVVTGHINGAQFVDLVKGTFTAFTMANGAEHLISLAKDYVKGKQLPASDNLISSDGSEPTQEGK